MHRGRRVAWLALLLCSAALATVLHVVFVFERLPDVSRAAPYVLAGWGCVGLAFYAMGRLFASPGPLPSMRLADVGLGLFFLAAIAGIVLEAVGGEALGGPGDAALEIYLLPALAIYAGLALVGWALGRRSKAIDRITGEE